jgi:hypothetical protein
MARNFQPHVTKNNMCSFLCLKLRLINFWRKKIGVKAAIKMLVKLTPGEQYIPRCPKMMIQGCFERFSGVVADLSKKSHFSISRVFHRFRQAKFDNGDSRLSLSQLLLLSQLHQKWSSLQKWSKLTQNY